jgi:putative FmdB family regulatory protein
MPLYTYDCAGCSATIERRQSFNEPPLSECPDCGGALRKVLHPVGIIFKGSGWYCTDNRPKSTASESKSETKSESKSESKSEAA